MTGTGNRVGHISTPGSPTIIHRPPTQSFPRKRESRKYRIIPTLHTGRASLDSSFQSTPTYTWGEKGGCDPILHVSCHCSIIPGVEIFSPVAQSPCTWAIRLLMDLGRTKNSPGLLGSSFGRGLIFLEKNWFCASLLLKSDRH